MSGLDHADWWASLNHGGLLIAPAKLPEFFGGDLPSLGRAESERLRREVVRMLDDEKHMGAFLDHVFEQLLGLESSRWLKANQVDATYAHTAVTGEAVRPRRVWRGEHGAVLPLFATDGKWGKNAPRIGVGRGRRAVSRVIEWLRNADQKIAVLTNGRQIRLVHAGPDYDAFCEWDIELWFDEGAPGPQVTALRRLLGRPALTAEKVGEPPPLLQAILASRKGQGELSAVLGERVRQAVEELITASSEQLDPIVGTAPGQVTPNEVYIAATRVIMRLVVVLFAEARELLPRDNPLYHGSYGLQGLREELDRAAGGRSARLRHRHGAWPRLLGLFRLVYAGSGHEELPIPAYGGGLFEPGREDGDGISRALRAIEAPTNTISDDVVHRMIELLTRSRVKLRQGRSSTWVEAPVDFSDLSSEYIGILYEGLLDYELRRAPKDDPMVFLNIGDQPALPLSRLDGMTVKERAELLKKLSKESKKGADPQAEEEEGEEEAEENDLDDSDDEVAAGEPDGEDDSQEVEDEVSDTEAEEGLSADSIRVYREMVDIWARNAVCDAGWTKRGADLNDPEVVAKARGLVRRVVLPGHWFLVRWGGTRKGAGTFYTRPQLAGPTTRRTLEPLAYLPVKESKDPGTGLVEVEEWAPRKPEEILALKVCDPAMGSGSFLVSALRYLTDALFESLHHHGRLESNAEGTIARLADGVAADHPSAETLPVPRDHESFEDLLRARLKRHVVERCIYGVDIDPVAVELARLALWIETMDRSLPFEFLDHKLKVGNSLVGCWFDRFQDYPIMAWEREGGDKDHKNFVHHFREVVATRGKNKGKVERKGDKWTQAIKGRKNEIKAELASLLRERVQPTFSFGDDGATADTLHEDARKALEEMHAIPVHDAEERARVYANRIKDNPAFRELKRAFDTWCALWFWPGDRLDLAPGPRALVKPSTDALHVVDELAQKVRFFHWELEFPDVFGGERRGFDAVIGNPPWNTVEPQSVEFFCNHDPLYRTYRGKEAERSQRNLFEGDQQIEDSWLRYVDGFKCLTSWVRSVAATDRGEAAVNLPFSRQGGGKINLFKLFVEASWCYLQTDGRLGLVVDGALYFDQGSGELRRLLLDRSQWEWLFGYENTDGIFNIKRSYKFCIVVATKGKTTAVTRVAFMRRSIGDWERAKDLAFGIRRDAIHRISPEYDIFVEISKAHDFSVLATMHDEAWPVGSDDDESWALRYRQSDFNITSNKKDFHLRSDIEGRGSGRQSIYGVWLTGPWRSGGRQPVESIRDVHGSHWMDLQYYERILLPLYQGRMIGQFDFSKQGWVSGTGQRAVWEAIDCEAKHIAPQYLVEQDAHRESQASARSFPAGLLGRPRAVFKDVVGATETRTMTAAVIPDFACSDSVQSLYGSDPHLLVAVLNSFAFDFVVRLRGVVRHLRFYSVSEIGLPKAGTISRCESTLRLLSMRLGAIHPVFARDWLAEQGPRPWRAGWALQEAERTRLRVIIDALVAFCYGLSEDDLAWVLSECDYPAAFLGDRVSRRQLRTTGFWRVDKDKPPELRHTVLSLVAFHELKKVGLDAFLNMNDGEGWMLPETLRLADYGLGHDDRAKEHQPVAAALGPRFYDWQLEQSVEESWEECERHAEILDKILPLPDSQPSQPKERQKPQAGVTDLFGEPVRKTSRRRKR